MAELANLSVVLPRDEAERLKAYARREDRSVASVVRQALRRTVFTDLDTGSNGGGD